MTKYERKKFLITKVHLTKESKRPRHRSFFYQDFVVGAPYENSGTGVIYVYHGGKEGPSTKPSQKIVGSDIRPGIQGFGISFSRSLDIDGNNYDGKWKTKKKIRQLRCRILF
jgi:hypothetical protein